MLAYPFAFQTYSAAVAPEIRGDSSDSIPKHGHRDADDSDCCVERA